MNKFIAHVDMDAFFAAIEQRDNPEFRGKPVVIGADPKGGKGRGVASTCSYEARKFGIHSAMPISIAYKKCPEAVFLPVNMEEYSKVSAQIYDIFCDFTPKVEMVSIDEAFLDITGSFHIFGTPMDTCRLIKAKINKECGLTASLGLASTKMAAKIASDLEKPDGLVEVKQDELLNFLMPLDIGKIPGIGKKTKVILNNMGIQTIGELAKKNLSDLTQSLGINGEYFWQLANGIDERELEKETQAKSISNEFTFSQDTMDEGKIESALIGLSEKVSDRMRHEGLKAKTITLKIRTQGFKTYTRAMTLTKATNFADAIYKVVKKLFYNFELNHKKVRLLGVKASNLMSVYTKDSLFDDEPDSKNQRLYRALDTIKEKFGRGAIHRAGNTDL